MNLIEEGIEIARGLEDSFRKLDQKWQRWKATLKLREEEKEERRSRQEIKRH
jgi:hypothetical protein